MASQKDKDYHKLRNPEKYGLTPRERHTDLNVVLTEDNRYSHCERVGTEFTKEDAEANSAYEKLWEKYGKKSMVSNKRRRNSTRKSNQRTKKIIRRIERAQGKESWRNEIKGDTTEN